jgi:hypothetical protein
VLAAVLAVKLLDVAYCCQVFKTSVPPALLRLHDKTFALQGTNRTMILHGCLGSLAALQLACWHRSNDTNSRTCRQDGQTVLTLVLC